MGSAIRLNKTGCAKIIQNDKYLVTIGDVVAVYRKEDFAPVVQFPRMVNVSDGWFLDRETIVVVSTSNVFYMLSIEKEERIWMSRELSGRRYTEGCFTLDSRRGDIFGIVPGDDAWSFCYAVAIRPGEGVYINVTLHIEPILAINEVVACYEDNSVTFIHGGNTGEACFNRMWRGYPPFHEPFELVWQMNQDSALSGPYLSYHHTENYLFSVYGGQHYNHPVYLEWIDRKTDAMCTVELPEHFRYSFPSKPRWVQGGKYLVITSDRYVLVMDFLTREPVARYIGKYISCGEIVNDKFIMGTWAGTYVYPFPCWAEWGAPPIQEWQQIHRRLWY